MNCLCNTKIDKQKIVKLAKLVSKFTEQRAICGSLNEHNFKSRKRYNGMHYICTVCGVARSEQYYKLHGDAILNG